MRLEAAKRQLAAETESCRRHDNTSQSLIQAATDALHQSAQSLADTRAHLSDITHVSQCLLSALDNSPCWLFLLRVTVLHSVFAIANPSVICLSVIRNVHTPYTLVEIFGNVSMPFYPSQPLTTMQNFMEIVPGEPLHCRLNTRGVAKYRSVGPVEGHISETVQDSPSGTIND